MSWSVRRIPPVRRHEYRLQAQKSCAYQRGRLVHCQQRLRGSAIHLATWQTNRVGSYRWPDLGPSSTLRIRFVAVTYLMNLYSSITAATSQRSPCGEQRTTRPMQFTNTSLLAPTISAGIAIVNSIVLPTGTPRSAWNKTPPELMSLVSVKCSRESAR